MREERLDEFTCDRCKKTGRASKKTDIVKLPPLLVLHLSRYWTVERFSKLTSCFPRFYQDGMYTRKKQNSVNFDLRNLNLGQFAIDGFESIPELHVQDVLSIVLDIVVCPVNQETLLNFIIRIFTRFSSLC